MLAYLTKCLGEGRLAIPGEEIVNAVIPPEHPEWRRRPAYRYGLERFLRRNVVNAIDAPDGSRHYFIGNYPTPELRASLGL